MSSHRDRQSAVHQSHRLTNRGILCIWLFREQGGGGREMGRGKGRARERLEGKKMGGEREKRD